jgi:hypothetical protein
MISSICVFTKYPNSIMINQNMYTVCPLNEADFLLEYPANRSAKLCMVLTAKVCSSLLYQQLPFYHH